ncbi:hypothetical protein HPB50_023845 [Hyalomma asiaticum]|uniref:Uncharacterized protein n=1 Tax=Hyalomma asiaticum TaxID=266040 RepID=A0ACB7S3S6_HYAAI|nr:hypothetical protein HPB50_023845 [Hyalomma asiaticum]
MCTVNAKAKDFQDGTMLTKTLKWLPAPMGELNRQKPEISDNLNERAHRFARRLTHRDIFLAADTYGVFQGDPVAAETSYMPTAVQDNKDPMLASQQQLTDGGGTDSSFRQRRHNSYPSDASSPQHTSVDMNAELMARLMASIERRLSAPPKCPRTAVCPATPPTSPTGLLSPGTAAQPAPGAPQETKIHLAGGGIVGMCSPRSIIKKARSQSIPAVIGLDEQQRVRKVVRIGSQEISSTVTYVPYDYEAALQETVRVANTAGGGAAGALPELGRPVGGVHQ